MDRTRYQRIKEIVEVALEMPADTINSYLNEQCGSDQKLKEEVEALLNIDVDESFLENTAFTVHHTDEAEHLEQVGRIKINRLLARGGMGEVYEGEDTLLKRPVAVKIINAALRMSEDRRAGFLNEAQVLSSLQHPNICQVYDFFADGDRDVLVLELIEGKTLRQFISKTRAQKDARPNRSVALEMAREMAAALTAAHERGIVHRDFKPENVMITPQGQVKVLDFGLARAGSVAPTASDSETQAQANLTTLSGTPGYMSPEQARSETATVATDVWSLGLVMVELLCGESPFPNDLKPGQLMETTRKAEVELPSSLPRAEARLLQKMLSAEVSERPSARSVLNDIIRIQGRTKRRVTAAAAVVAAFVLAFSGWKYTSDLKKEQQVAEAARNDAEDLVGFMLEDLHTDLRALGRLDLLEAAAGKALDYYGTLDSSRMQASHGKAAVGLIRVGEVLSDRGRKDEASALLYQAVEALDAMHQRQPQDDLVSYRLGLALMKLVDILKTAGRFEEAALQSKRAVELGRLLARDYEPGTGPAGRPNPEERWRVLLRAMYMDADILVRQGLSDEAVPVLEEVVELAKPAAANSPGLTINLADIQFKRCDTYNELNEPVTMLDACLGVMALDATLREQEPDDFELLKVYVGDHNLVAKAYLALGQFDQALEVANKGVALGQELIDWEPSNESTRNEHAGNLIMKGKALRANDMHAESRAAFREASEILAPLTVDREEITFMHHAFTAHVYLEEFDQANELGWSLDAKGFSRREYRDLCRAHQQLDCGAKSE